MSNSNNFYSIRSMVKGISIFPVYSIKGDTVDNPVKEINFYVDEKEVVEEYYNTLGIAIISNDADNEDIRLELSPVQVASMVGVLKEFLKQNKK